MPNILVIDDEIDVRCFFKDILEDHGFNVLEASTGREGLDLIKSPNDIDAVITDIIMPEMNGVDMIKAIRNFNKRLPLIAVSGFEGELDHARRSGANVIFTKPPKMDEIIEFLKYIKEQTA